MANEEQDLETKKAPGTENAEQAPASAEADWGEAMKEQQEAEAKAKAEKAPAAPAAEAKAGGAGAKPAAPPQKSAPKPPAKPATFGTLTSEQSGISANIDMILDIPVTISVEIGRSRMIVKDLLQLGQGAVVELEKVAGEPMEILVNGKLIARGEAVVVNEKFGVKLTDIVSPTERINKLK